MSYGRIELCLLALKLCAWATTTTAQEPPRNCISTGPTCIESCIGLADGQYQWCGGCHWFIQCSGNVTAFTKCSGELLFSDETKNCQPVSDTCHECTVDTTSNDVNATKPTTTSTPPVGALCQSTGPNCRSDCYSTPNGNYQWCGRCDYFLQCSGGSEYYTECPSDLYYDDSTKSCEVSSTTCFQSPCYEDLTTAISTAIVSITTVPTTTVPTTTVPTTTVPTTTVPTTTVPTTGYDPCSSSPCVNGGTCINEGSAFSCQCPPNFNGLQCQTDNPCFSSPCLNGGTCRNTNGELPSCDCLPSYTGPECQTEFFDANATCGDLMTSTPYDPEPGWTNLCEITKNDTALQNTPCEDLLQGLPIYGDSAGLLQAGGNFGCWLTHQYPDDIQEACHNDYQQNQMLAACLSCTHLIVCMRYP